MWLHGASTLIAGGLLLFAGMVKLQPNSGDSIASFLPSALVLVTPHIEVFLGIALLFGLGMKVVFPISSVVYCIFLVANVLAWSRGQASCGCFGNLAVHPGVMAGIDAMVLLGLVSAWVAQGRSLAVPASSAARGLYWLAGGASAALVAALLVSNSLKTDFHGLRSWARGEMLTLKLDGNPPKLELGKLATIEVRVENLSNRSITLVAH